MTDDEIAALAHKYIKPNRYPRKEELIAFAHAARLEISNKAIQCLKGLGYTFEQGEWKAGSPEFQQRVAPWMDACFGPVISKDAVERNHRFLEESLELVQACGCTKSEAHQLVDYVYGRPVGEKSQEVGGVMVTLAALCLAQSLDMHDCGETELKRIWGAVEKIRAKQAAKPKNCPLPEADSPEAKPVAWRWSPKGSSRWIYDPDIEWLNRQSTDVIDKEPLYSTPPTAVMVSAKSGVTAPVDMAMFISSLVNDANISGDDLPHQVVEKLMAAAKGGG